MERTLQNHDLSFWGRVKASSWLPFLFLGGVYFVIHLMISPTTGDDLFYFNLFSAPGFDPLAFSVSRYLTWSSRTLIEFVMMAAVLMPPILWKLIDTLLLVVIAIFLSKLLLRDEQRRKGNVVIAALMLMLPFYIMNSAGWIATTTNYLWPLALGLVALYPLRKLVDGKKLRAYEYPIYSACLLFAANAEQMCFVLLAVYAAFAVYMTVKKKISVYVLIQLVLCVLSLVYILACPGNETREIAEAQKWYPGFLDLSLFEKINLGLWAAFKDLFLMQYLPIFAFVLISCMLVWKKQKKTLPRIVAVIPVVSIPFMFALRFFRKIPWLRDLFSNGPDAWMGDPAALFLVFIMMVTLVAILVSIYLLFKKNIKTFILAGILILGFASKAAVGLSPTVWASGQRTALFMVVAFIAATVLLLNEWDFRNRKATRLLYTLSFLGGLCGIAVNLYVEQCPEVDIKNRKPGTLEAEFLP